jgi:hypothetical protein
MIDFANWASQNKVTVAGGMNIMRRIDCHCACYRCESGVEHCHNPLSGCKVRKKKRVEIPSTEPIEFRSPLIIQIEELAPSDSLVLAPR